VKYESKGIQVAVGGARDDVITIEVSNDIYVKTEGN